MACHFMVSISILDIMFKVTNVVKMGGFWASTPSLDLCSSLAQRNARLDIAGATFRSSKAVPVPLIMLHGCISIVCMTCPKEQRCISTRHPDASRPVCCQSPHISLSQSSKKTKTTRSRICGESKSNYTFLFAHQKTVCHWPAYIPASSAAESTIS